MTRRGDRLRAMAVRIFDARTMERVIDPAVADLKHEPRSMSRYLAVLKAMALCSPEASMKVRSVVAWSGLALVGVTGLFEVRPLLFAWQQQTLGPWTAVYLMPQAIVVAVSVALTLGILSALGGRRVSRRAAAWALGVALAVSLASFLNVGWLTPEANQAFRVEVFGRSYTSSTGAPLARGFNELTFPEVRHQYAIAVRNPGAVDPLDLHFLAVSYHGRWALSLGPIAFTIFALVLCGLRPIVRWTAGAAVSVAYLGYLLYMSVPVLPALDGRWLGGAAWYPLVALAVVTSLLTRFNRRQDHEAAW